MKHDLIARRISTIAISAVLFALTAHGDTIELKTGERIEGAIRQSGPTYEVIEVAGKAISIPLEKIRAIYFGTVSAKLEGGPSLLGESLDALKALRSVTESGVAAYRDYAPRVLDARIKIDKYLSTGSGDPAELRSSIGLAMREFELAARAWDGTFPGHEDLSIWKAIEANLDTNILAKCPYIKAIVQRLQLAAAYQGLGIRDSAVVGGQPAHVALWKCAVSEIENAERYTDGEGNAAPVVQHHVSPVALSPESDTGGSVAVHSVSNSSDAEFADAVPQRTQVAVDALRKLRSATRGRPTYSEYSTVLAETRVAITTYLASPDKDDQLRVTIKRAMRDYERAFTAWASNNSPDDLWISASTKVTEAEQSIAPPGAQLAGEVPKVSAPNPPERANHTQASLSRTPISPAVITTRQYDHLRVGMTYRQACEAIGTNGVEASQATVRILPFVGSTTVVMYHWMNPNGSNITAMFKNGKLMTKAAFRLP